MVKKISIVLVSVFFVFALCAADLSAVINGKKFYKPADDIVLDCKATAGIKPKSKIVWNVVNESGEKVVFENLDESGTAIKLQKRAGKYKATVVVANGSKKSSAEFEFYAAEKDTAKITIIINAPENTPEDDNVFLGHNIPEAKEWVPYATLTQKVSKNIYKTELSLETGKSFKFQVTRGSWANKARDNNDSDYSVVLLPYKDEEVAVSGFTWGKLIEKDNMERKPLLLISKPDATEMKVVYQDNKDDSVFTFGEEGKNGDVVTPVKYKHGKVAILGNLKPGVKYFYKEDNAADKKVFKTPDSDGVFRFVAASDSQNIASVIEGLSRKIAAKNPDVFVFAGDACNNGLRYMSWEMTFFKPFVPNIQGIPFAIAPGNHEESSPLFNKYFDTEKSYSTFVWENVRFLMIDSEISFFNGSPQYKFIEDTLKNNKSKWIVVVTHESPYSNTPRHYSNLYSRKEIVPLFEKYKVDIVFSGHNHVYERTKKVNGVKYVTLPCMGSNKPKGTDKDKNEDSSFSEKQLYGVDGYMTADVNKNKINFNLYDANDAVVDSFELLK